MKNIFSSLACLMLCSLSALGHGSMADPISRSYEVFLENPESPTSAAGRAAVAVAGTQAFMTGTRSTYVCPITTIKP